MDRKKFIKNSLTSLGAIVAVPTIITSCSNDDALVESDTETGGGITGDCELSPNETGGPFPIKSPSELVRENIIGDRSGVAMLMNLVVQEQSENCTPLADVYVDVWHCDADGYYSQYGGTGMQPQDFTDKNFLRGRGTTDANGKVSFISIFPGWYRGRAPHIHLEVLDKNGNSLKTTQIAFPKDVCDTVYATSNYNGTADTQNENDNVFSDSIDGNMLDEITGNVNDGYTLTKTIVV